MGALAPNDLKFNEATGRWWCVWHQTALEVEDMLMLRTSTGVSYPVCPTCVVEANPQTARTATTLCFFHDGSRGSQPKRLATAICQGDCGGDYCNECVNKETICVFCAPPGVA
jgi:hypothetical protein